MRMSWVAARKVTTNVHRAVSHASTRGCVDESSAIAKASAIWTSSSQPRRIPSPRVSHDSLSRSTIGAHTNLKT